MQTTKLVLDQEEARELYREYKKHQHYSTPIDTEVRRTYQALAQGKTVIKALESIVAAGVGADGYPKLAIVRADTDILNLRIWDDGSAEMRAQGATSRWRGRNTSRCLIFQNGSFPRPDGIRRKWSAEAIVPTIPIYLRPKRGIENYHILFEAEWSPVPPRDPYLLRRIGKGDLWLVVAAWDLTEVERAALATRLSA